MEKRPIRLKARAFWRSPAGKELKARWRTERRGRSQPKNLGRTGPNRTKLGPVIDPWQVARALTSGRSTTEVASDFKMGVRTVSYKAELLRLTYGSVFLCDEGIPFRDEKLTAIRRASGFLTAEQFEQFVGLPRHACAARHRGRRGIRVPETARAVITWRDKAIRALAEAPRDKDRGYQTYKVVHTFLPDLASLRDALVETFAVIRSELRHWQMADLWQFTEERVRGGAGPTWHRTLCYLWEIESILEARLDRLRKTDPRSVRRFVREILGVRYGVHPQQIKLALQSGVRTIPPTEMFRLLHLILRSAQPEVEKAPRKLGRKKSSAEETAWFKIGRMVESKIQNGDPSLSEEDRVIAARNAVHNETRYPRDTVVRYHLKYRSLLKKHSPDF